MIDQDHIDKINQLIPMAIKIADKQWPKDAPSRYTVFNVDGHRIVRDEWNVAYHQAMDRLAIALGLRV